MDFREDFILECRIDDCALQHVQKSSDNKSNGSENNRHECEEDIFFHDESFSVAILVKRLHSLFILVGIINLMRTGVFFIVKLAPHMLAQLVKLDEIIDLSTQLVRYHRRVR